MVENVEPHITKRFNFHKKIGQGAYGVVWKVTDKKTKKIVALKKLFGAFRDNTDAQRTYREVMILQELNGHDNIISILNVIKAENGQDLYVLFDYMEADLYNIIRCGILQDVHKRYIIYQIFRGLKYIHSAEIIHRDLKPSNIFINSNCQIKIGDFGLARTLSSGKTGYKAIVTDYVATRWYRAPEMLMGAAKYGKPIDMWSVGCILYELITSKPLFPGKSTKHMFALFLELTGIPTEEEFDEIKNQCELQFEYYYFPDKLPKISIKTLLGKYTSDSDTIDLLSKLLVLDPKKRITVEEALNHPYVANFHKVDDEITCDKPINIPLDDNKKYDLETYREKLYEEILRRKIEIRKRLIEYLSKNKPNAK